MSLVNSFLKPAPPGIQYFLPFNSSSFQIPGEVSKQPPIEKARASSRYIPSGAVIHPGRITGTALFALYSFQQKFFRQFIIIQY